MHDLTVRELRERLIIVLNQTKVPIPPDYRQAMMFILGFLDRALDDWGVVKE